MKEKTDHLYAAWDRAMALTEAVLACMRGENLCFDPVLARDYTGDEKAIEELRGLSKEAQGFLQHHINNVLCAVYGHIDNGHPAKAQLVVWQFIDIMKKINPDAEVRNDTACVKAEDNAGVHPAAAPEAVR